MPNKSNRHPAEYDYDGYEKAKQALRKMKAKADVRRTCKTCLHYDVDLDEEPCLGCGRFTGPGADLSRWQPAVRLEQVMPILAEVVDMLQTEEESDSGTRFRPTHFSSCRVMHMERWNRLFPQLVRAVQVWRAS